MESSAMLVDPTEGLGLESIESTSIGTSLGKVPIYPCF